jgi:hypothetical protein
VQAAGDGEMIKTYLGDGVYAMFDGYDITLTTENGLEVTNTIVLEPEVLSALYVFVELIKAQTPRATR